MRIMHKNKAFAAGETMANRTSLADSSFDTERAPDVGAQAQAALLLLESLIHSLLDNGALTKEQALEAIGSAYEVKSDSAAADYEPPERLQRSLAILSKMRMSIRAHSGPYDDRPDERRIDEG